LAKLGNVSRKRVLRALSALGFECDEGRGKGSHVLILHPTDRSRRTTLPARDPVAAGTLRGMLRDLGVSREEFESVL